MNHCGRIQNFSSRRALLQKAGGGIGMLALNSLLNQTSFGIENNPTNPLASKQPHYEAKAKNVIWLFINGGPSHVDTWDYKPGLVKADGQKLEGFDNTTGFFDNAVGPLLKSPFEFKQHGESGMWASSLFPNLSKHVDKMAFIKSFHRGLPKGHAANWSSGFLPGAYQGTWVRSKGDPIPNLKRTSDVSDQQQRAQLDLIGKINNEHQKNHPHEKELTARIRSFELAYRMQQEAPECFEIDNEPEHIKSLYGLNEKRCSHFARQCLMARRMVERGVRFVQIYSGGMENARSWDGHGNIQKNHSQFAGETDQPIAGLLSDLEQRGLLKDTLVIWGGEFGRLPVSQLSGGKPTGRDHNPHAGCYWFAGGGSKGGTSYGETDEIGHKAAVNKVEIHDIHATILHLLGMDHKKLTYLHSGRRFRLTDVAGNVINDIVA